MKHVVIRGKTVACFQDADLAEPAFQALVEKARALWEQRQEEYIDKNGHVGSAVIGAGFTVPYLAKGARKPRSRRILPPPELGQGSLSWETSKDEIQKVFNDAGIEVGYDWGMMD